MKYIYVFFCFFYASSLIAEDEYMILAPEGGGEKEMPWEPTSDQGDSPKSDIHENDVAEVY
jgi:hypothetical protein